MEYQTLATLKNQMEMQISVLDFMDALVIYDKEKFDANPDKDQPPVAGVGLLKSHFMTQKKACEAVLGLVERHLPEFKEIHDKEQADKAAERKAQLAKKPAAPSGKPSAADTPAGPTPPKIDFSNAGMNLFAEV